MPKNALASNGLDAWYPTGYSSVVGDIYSTRQQEGLEMKTSFNNDLDADGFYAALDDGSLVKTSPARIVCYDEGSGEWTIDAEDEWCRCLRDKHGNYPASIWNNAENDCDEMTENQAIAAAVEMRSELSLVGIPVYVVRCGNCELAAP